MSDQIAVVAVTSRETDEQAGYAEVTQLQAREQATQLATEAGRRLVGGADLAIRTEGTVTMGGGVYVDLAERELVERVYTFETETA